QGVPYFRGLDRTGTPDGVSKNHRRVIAQRRHGIRCAAESLAVRLHEASAPGRADLRVIMRREMLALDGFSADLNELVGFPSVTAEERDLEPQLSGLDTDQGDVGVITRNKHRIRIGAFD